jgi:hypothetical protein
MRMKSGSSFCITLVYLIFLSCSPGDNQLKTGWWKYEQGLHLGDVLILRDSNVKGDTIFISGKPVANLVSVNTHRIEVVSLYSGERGSYIYK